MTVEPSSARVASVSGGDELSRYRHYIDGAFEDPESGHYLESISPATGAPVYAFARGTDRDVDRAVTAAHRCFESPSWRRLTQTRRGALLRRLADLIGENAEELAVAESEDNGKLLREMRGQLVALPEWVHYFGGLADKVEGRVIPGLNPAMLNYTVREPVGVVAAITPWNSPLLLTMFKLAPALAMGCTAVVKPSEHTTASVLRLAPLFAEAGFPSGAINVVSGLGAEVGEPLVRHRHVRTVAFTGSETVGAQIAAAAGERFAGTVLELGGKSPNIVFADADLDNAVNGIIAGIFAAAGQTCVAGSRVLLQRPIYDEVLTRLVDRARTIRIGDPMTADTELGPLAFEAHRDRVHAAVSSGIAAGATLQQGGTTPAAIQQGYYYEPTILTGVPHDAELARNEIFGPVAAVFPFKDEDEAVAIANDTRYGLAAGVWTRDLARAHRLARELSAGTVWINTYRSVAPMSPFGGFGQSGGGKENGAEAALVYTRVKSVWVNTDDGPFPDPFVLRN